MKEPRMTAWTELLQRRLLPFLDFFILVQEGVRHLLRMSEEPVDGKALDITGIEVGADGAISPIIGVPNVNTYQQKKNLAQGMMDLALMSANASQLRYILEATTAHPYYYATIMFIGLSITIQILVGVGLILNSRYDVNDEKDICKADKINNMTVLGIFLITIVNVFITSFCVAAINTDEDGFSFLRRGNSTYGNSTYGNSTYENST